MKIEVLVYKRNKRRDEWSVYLEDNTELHACSDGSFQLGVWKGTPGISFDLKPVDLPEKSTEKIAGELLAMKRVITDDVEDEIVPLLNKGLEMFWVYIWQRKDPYRKRISFKKRGKEEKRYSLPPERVARLERRVRKVEKLMSHVLQ